MKLQWIQQSSTPSISSKVIQHAFMIFIVIFILVIGNKSNNIIKCDERDDNNDNGDEILRSRLIRPRRGQLFRKLKEINMSGRGRGDRSGGTNSKNNIETLRLLIKTFNHASPTSREDTDAEQLFAKLGDGFNPIYQSVKEPLNLGQVVKVLSGSRSSGAESESRRRSSSEQNQKSTVPRSLDTMIPAYVKRYLEDLSYCPLAEKWIDLGEYLWPRYFKFTHCVRKKCSYPEGLHCQPAAAEVAENEGLASKSNNNNNNGENSSTTTKTLLQVPLLYWTCMPQHLRKKDSKGCGAWSKIYVDVVSRCKCSGCNDGGGGGVNG